MRNVAEKLELMEGTLVELCQEKAHLLLNAYFYKV